MDAFQQQAFLAGLLLICFIGAFVAEPRYCERGEYWQEGLHGADDPCVPCDQGFFQEKDRHREDHCHKCTLFNGHDPQRRLVDECTRFHDTVVRCVKGFYYVYDSIGGDCKPCTNCPSQGKYEIQACSDTEDAICCDKEDMMVKNGTCVEPLVCGPGQFLVPAQVAREEECRQCELGSTNPEAIYWKQSCDHTNNYTQKETRKMENKDAEGRCPREGKEIDGDDSQKICVPLIPYGLLGIVVFLLQIFCCCLFPVLRKRCKKRQYKIDRCKPVVCTPMSEFMSESESSSLEVHSI